MRKSYFYCDKKALPRYLTRFRRLQFDSHSSKKMPIDFPFRLTGRHRLGKPKNSRPKNNNGHRNHMLQHPCCILLKGKPSPHLRFRHYLDYTQEKSFHPCNRPPQRGHIPRQCTLKHFIIDSCPRFLDKRQSPISFKFSQPHQASNCPGFFPLMGA